MTAHITYELLQANSYYLHTQYTL